MESRQLSRPSARPGGVVLVAVGGLDPGCGAGLGRDLLTAAALGARGRVIATAWTEQSEAGVQAVEPRAPAAVEAGLRQALRAEQAMGSAVAVKIGMVATPAIAAAVVAALDGWTGAVVLDPVLTASSGGALFDGDPTGLMPLARRATLVTPNLGEAAALTGLAVTCIAEAASAARALRRAGCAAVLVKGGHLPDSSDPSDLLIGPSDLQASDLLTPDDRAQMFSGRRIPGRSPRGTGCALASAVAIRLAEGLSMTDAIESARSWLVGQIADAIDVGEERYLPSSRLSGNTT